MFLLTNSYSVCRRHFPVWHQSGNGIWSGRTWPRLSVSWLSSGIWCQILFPLWQTPMGLIYALLVVCAAKPTFRWICCTGGNNVWFLCCMPIPTLLPLLMHVSLNWAIIAMFRKWLVACLASVKPQRTGFNQTFFFCYLILLPFCPVGGEKTIKWKLK